MKKESDQTLLKTAILQANIILDTMMLDMTIGHFFRLDLKFEEQKYPRYLNKLSYTSLVDLMNSKLKLLSVDPNAYISGFSL